MRPWHLTQFASKMGCTLPDHSAAASAPHAKRTQAKANRKVKTGLQSMCEEKLYAFTTHSANQILLMRPNSGRMFIDTTTTGLRRWSPSPPAEEERVGEGNFI